MNKPSIAPESAADSTPAPEAQAKVEKPHAHFDHPTDVVVDPALSKDEKVRALEALEQDAKQLATASDEGMGGGEPTKLHEVLAAKDALELPPADLAFSVVLQNLKAKLPNAVGTETHDLIVHAIQAVEAACAAIAEMAPASTTPMSSPKPGHAKPDSTTGVAA